MSESQLDRIEAAADAKGVGCLAMAYLLICLTLVVASFLAIHGYGKLLSAHLEHCPQCLEQADE